jgi:hypothetical protein
VTGRLSSTMLIRYFWLINIFSFCAVQNKHTQKCRFKGLN